ncbi:efflux RND transporter periplasmic adaptor subunit [Legionella jordanis]|uniref:Membrane-fusion protein AcrA n=1 Tax=Legionella jordanis TaxID=456 RepID=A0A0W0VCR0_9GAMM|nr:efflux RND transporter periplasmic adaptor subunit [Legionella jordanis]KTD17902.1 membrane-fusion protein AcrA [Legionella jordanis]RMX02399.1 HlyD family efflux transporter periplasmic adaptor subunit [Legionella jordanis]RMX21759.1 HlyD family efflux transporter periplasmic adaptor subunit [Legionella jordanis]VEH14007.1 Membrane-fusion protein [Legionella jordanis]HAT8713872.1 HlyD family efflux transporter periplasmic adaptor subunit [Legionella jordanis]
MNRVLNVFIIVFLASWLIACGNPQNQQKKELHTYVVKPEPVHKTLFFTGTIEPLHESAITTPVEGIIETMHHHYGQFVKKGEVVVTLNSNELQKQYNETLTEYLKSKDNYSIAKAKFVGTQELWDSGLMSKNNYLSEKSSLDTARMTLMQATRKLSEMLERMDDGSTKNLSSLSIAEFDKVRQALSSNHNRIRLKAPADGILLYPPKTNGDDKSNKLNVGTLVKSNQVIALVGDLSGVSVEIDVPEIDIDKIHSGMPATITGVALGKQTLQGQLVAVNVQASNTGNGSLPSFSAVVEVKNLTPEQRAWVKVGMSAAIAINIDSNNQLQVPISAVKQEKGSSMVKVQASDGSFYSRPVTTGAAQANKVIIASGLKSGDVVAYD